MLRTTLTAICFGLVSTASLAAEPLIGQATVLDGDTIRVRGVLVGLYGIAAPGPRQSCETAAGTSTACGTQAAKALAQHIGSANVKCEGKRADGHRRTIALCRLGNEDLSAWMVEQGLAVADRFTTADYKPLERKAWAKRKGLWAGVFDDPVGRKRDEYRPKQASAGSEPSLTGSIE